jgi:hypothetical protein
MLKGLPHHPESWVFRCFYYEKMCFLKHFHRSEVLNDSREFYSSTGFQEEKISESAAEDLPKSFK